MKLLLVDLDDTLIHTKAFKKNLFDSIGEIYSIRADIVEKVYEELKNENTADNWKKRFQDSLSKKFLKNFDIDKPISDSISKLTVSEPIVKYVKQFEGEKVIFTYGDPDIQNEKINSLHLAEGFDDIIITTTKKDIFLTTIIAGERVILNSGEYNEVTVIDNDEALLSFITSKYPWIKIINTLDLV